MPGDLLADPKTSPISGSDPTGAFIDEYNPDRTWWARFSPDRTMRYRLARSLTQSPMLVDDSGMVSLARGASGAVVFLMLNPSTADAMRNDPTIRRGIAFARAWGATIYEAANIDAYRSTDPKALYSLDRGARGDDAINDAQILAACQSAYRVVAAWGVHGQLDGRGTLVRRMLADHGIKVYHLGLTKGGHPKHPLYLKGSTEPVEWPL